MARNTAAAALACALLLLASLSTIGAAATPSKTCVLPSGEPCAAAAAKASSAVARVGPLATCTGAPAPVKNAAPWSCAGTSAGSSCTTPCRAGYGPSPVTALCNAGASWEAPTGTCARVCTTQPPAELLSGGTWSPSCAGTIAIGARCFGECTGGLVGTPSIMCTASGWAASSLAGQCAPQPVCNGLPSAVPLNAQPWPATCAGAASGATCTAQCNSAYQAQPPPTITCVGGAWGPPSPPECYRPGQPGPPPFPSCDLTPAALCPRSSSPGTCFESVLPSPLMFVNAGAPGWYRVTFVQFWGASLTNTFNAYAILFGAPDPTGQPTNFTVTTAQDAFNAIEAMRAMGVTSVQPAPDHNYYGGTRVVFAADSTNHKFRLWEDSGDGYTNFPDPANPADYIEYERTAGIRFSVAFFARCAPVS